MKNNKLGLYARYCKITGCFIQTVVKQRSDIYKSNKDSKTFVHELLTEKPSQIYDYPYPIPKKIDAEEEFKCDICGEYYPESEMHHISEGSSDEFLQQCEDCL